MMQLPVGGVLHTFIDARVYRQQHNLPDDFGVNTFEAKSYDGLGSISHAGDVLRAMKDRFLAEMPAYPLPHQWLLMQEQEQNRFHTLLVETNHHVGLREAEIDFAVAGFVNVYSQWVYALIHAVSTRTSPKPFEQIYRDWLDESIRVASQSHHYESNGEVWQVQIVSHVYGRIGLQMQRGDIVEYVYDHSLACPAERFMETLMTEVAAHIQMACGL
ncbi:MAG: hypothetical protein L0154_18840 [Chloroflexi bacterium]|nr:hypothetical protein [Chloroflexota bacterium]